MRTTRFAALLALALFTALSATAGPLQDDLKARRTKAMERLGPDTLAIFWSAPARVYSGDVDYEYRQESNLLYLTESIAGDDSRPDAGQRHAARGALHPPGRRPARALGRPQPDGGGSHGPERCRDGDDRGPFRRVRGRDVLEAGRWAPSRANTTSSSPR